MELIILGVAIILSGGIIFYRLRKSEVQEDVLRARLFRANELYQAIRYEPSNERWVINKARNDVYFRKLDVRLKSWNPVVRRRLYQLPAALILGGTGSIAYVLLLLGMSK